ncbi:MAG: hypothetical protein JXB29_10845 [Sedimentisphaerales bacterium]|nr:hypothetical protein [Sedimentisphaerales bacterium]
MTKRFSQDQTLLVLVVGLSGWLVPGAGYFVLNEQKKAIIIFATITLIFLTGLYVGSIGVINPVKEWPWYLAQILNSPIVAALGHLTTSGDYPVYGRPNEIGQIYTSIAGLLNLLCIINCLYLAHLRNLVNRKG